MAGTITTRPSTEADRDLQLRIYASTRARELALTNWSDEQKDTFVRMQFEAQDRFYRAEFPDADFLVVLLDGAPAGRLYVHRAHDHILVIDIAVLPEAQGHGISRTLLGAIFDEADHRGLPVRGDVEVNNDAIELWLRLGFEITGQTGMHVRVERPCATSAS